MTCTARVSAVDAMSAACRNEAAAIPEWGGLALASTSEKEPDAATPSRLWGRRVAIIDRATRQPLVSATGPNAVAAYSVLLDKIRAIAAEPRVTI